MKTQRVFLQDHEPIDFIFKQNRYDFIVEEITNIKPKTKGNFLILKIKKELLSTWELLNIISKKLNIPQNLIGYAGLKDKNATTTQYISIPLNKSRGFEDINSKNIQILDSFKYDKKIKIGDLEANRFKIILKDIKPESLHIIYQTLSQIQKNGMPNYFGYQRFGKEYNFKQAKSIVYGEEVLNDKKLEKFLKLAYQSYFFNSWLAKRIEISKKEGSKKLIPLQGDIFNLNDKNIITGLLPGRDIIRAKAKARQIEEKYDDMFIHDKGYRRDAWVIPKNIKNKFISDKNQLQLEFTLPKSSYATVLIENLANKNFK